MERTLHCPNCTTEMCLMAHPAAWLHGADLQGLLLWECPKCEASLLIPSRNLNTATTTTAPPATAAKVENSLAAEDNLLAPTLDVGGPLGGTLDVPLDFGDQKLDQEQEFDFDNSSVPSDPDNYATIGSNILDSANAPLEQPDENTTASAEDVNEAEHLQLEPSASGTSENASWKVSTTPRRRRQEPSFLRKVVPPVLGGLAAFPIATAIMWYGVGKDIGSTGPFVAQYAPWIVPKHLRGGLGAFQSDGTLGKSSARSKTASNGGMSGSTSTPSTNRGDTAPRSGLPSLNKDEATSPKPSFDGRSGNVANNTKAEPKLSSEDENELSTSEKMMKSDDESSSQLDPLPGQGSSTELEPSEPSGNLRKTLDKLKELDESWSTTPDDKRRDALKAFYSSCNELAEQTAAISSKSIRAWQKPLDEFGNMLLNNTTYGKVLALGGQGKLPGIAAPKSGDHLLHIQEITVDRQSDAPHHTHSSNLMIDGKPATIMIPDALVKRAIDLDDVPTKCLFAGQVQVDDMGDAIYFVHWLLPSKP